MGLQAFPEAPMAALGSASSCRPPTQMLTPSLDDGPGNKQAQAQSPRWGPVLTLQASTCCRKYQQTLTCAVVARLKRGAAGPRGLFRMQPPSLSVPQFPH